MAQQVMQGGSIFQQLQSGVLIPYPYEVWLDGVYSASPKATPATPDETIPLPEFLMKGRKRMLLRPLWISGLGHTVDTQEPLVQLTYLDTQYRTQSTWLSRGQVTDARQLTALGAAGLPIDSENVKGALVYLRNVEAANGSTLTTMMVGHRSGPYMVEGHLGWLVGKQWIGHGKLEADPRTNAKYTLAFQPHGDAAAWYQKWRELRNSGWVLRFMMGATFAPPLLRLVKCRTFIVHHWGQSGVGKTAAAVFAQTAWGNPDLLYSSLNRTSISITEIFRHVTDLPVLYDEKQVSTVSSEELIYSICTGAGRERGARDGGLRQDRQQWLTVARTTGEVPLITNSDLGGQFNRLLQIHSPSFKDKREAESIYPFSAEHYGHAGPAFLTLLGKMLEDPNGLALLRQLNREFREALVNRIGIDSNHCQFGAVIATAQTLAESWLLDIPFVESRERALDDAFLAVTETAPKKQLTYAEKALSKLRDHWISNSGFYVDDTTEEGRDKAHRVFKMIGIETAWGMAFIPHEANDLLIKAGYEPERVWRDFHAQGWLVTNPDTPESALTHMPLRNGKSPEHPVYCIRPDIFFTSIDRTRRLQLIQGGITGLEVS
jgi:hypothetical protein